jgi:phenylacetate-CoA ligase
MPRHDHLLGRSDDMIIFRGVNVYPGQVAAVLQEFPALGSEYHILLTREHGRDSMVLQTERAKTSASRDADANLAQSVARKLQSQVLISATVEIAEYGSLPRSFGKSRRVTDNRM